jgi:hypothetical protein
VRIAGDGLDSSGCSADTDVRCSLVRVANDDPRGAAPVKLHLVLLLLFVLLAACAAPAHARGPWCKGPDFAKANPSQLAKIRYLAFTTGVDLPCVLRNHYGVDSPRDLTIAQAGHLIDALLRMQQDTFTAPNTLRNRHSARADRLDLLLLQPFVWTFGL